MCSIIKHKGDQMIVIFQDKDISESGLPLQRFNRTVLLASVVIVEKQDAWVMTKNRYNGIIFTHSRLDVLVQKAIQLRNEFDK
jgi:hypothetical protein